jgi:hypothetical protein
MGIINSKDLMRYIRASAYQSYTSKVKANSVQETCIKFQSWNLHEQNKTK